MKKIISHLNQYWHYTKYIPFSIWAIMHFPDYKPQPVSINNFTKWLHQFDENDRSIIIHLLKKIIYISEKQTESLLLKLNADLLNKLADEDITIKNVIFVQIHDPGSSSPVMLNMVRDRGRLERKGCYFIDGKNVRELNEVTSKLGQGAIIYVDDYAGTGNQFCTARDYLAEYIVGNFAEYFLLPAICEEAVAELNMRGIEPKAEIIHKKKERPLHPDSSLISNDVKKKLIEICKKIDSKGALGYKGLAAMIVFYRNSPNSLPVIFRGCMKQKEWKGLFPRTTDLP